LGNLGFQAPLNATGNSSFLYAQAHLDYGIGGWLYPLAELNYYHWFSGGDRGLPPAVGEVDGLINLGTPGVSGDDFLSVAVGAKVRLGPNLELGAAYETPLSSRKDFLQNRLLAELILRRGTSC